MRWILWLTAAVAALGLAPDTAEAQFRVCNKSSQEQLYVAVAYKESDRWVSVGWYTVTRGNCVVAASPMTERYYYVYAEDKSTVHKWNGDANKPVDLQFCVTRPERFQIYTRDCAARNYAIERFFQVDTGTQSSYTQSLVDSTPPAASPGGDPYRIQVDKAFAAAEREQMKDGYTLTHTVVTDSLKKGNYRSHPVRLEAGRRYRILARCDNDCSDLDLKLFNSAGVEVDADTNDDDEPMVIVQPPVAATYTVRVIMSDCSALSCLYSFGVFAPRAEPEDSDEPVSKIETGIAAERDHEQFVNVVRMRAAGDPVLEQIEEMQEQLPVLVDVGVEQDLVGLREPRHRQLDVALVVARLDADHADDPALHLLRDVAPVIGGLRPLVAGKLADVI